MTRSASTKDGVAFVEGEIRTTYKYAATSARALYTRYNEYKDSVYEPSTPDPPDNSSTWRLVSAISCGNDVIWYWEQEVI